MNKWDSGYRTFVWRWWKHWLSPSTYGRRLKWWYQRANRGWADCDVWSLDLYLASWLPDALRQIQSTKAGIPVPVLSDLEKGSYCESAYEEDLQRWNGILKAMIKGFEAKHRIGTFYHGHSLLRDPKDDWVGEDRKPSEETRRIYAEIQSREDADHELAEKGLRLFVEYFDSLWT